MANPWMALWVKMLFALKTEHVSFFSTDTSCILLQIVTKVFSCFLPFHCFSVSGYEERKKLTQYLVESAHFAVQILKVLCVSNQ